MALLRLSKLPGEEGVVDAFCCMLGAERGGGDSGGSESVIVLEGRSSRVVDSKFSRLLRVTPEGAVFGG